MDDCEAKAPLKQKKVVISYAKKKLSNVVYCFKLTKRLEKPLKVLD
jgi:hypothetical protein